MLKSNFLFLLVLTPILLRSTDNSALAQTNFCQEIRLVRRLAIAENLDDNTLAILQERYCNFSGGDRNISFIPRSDASQDCIDLSVMLQLAEMAAANSEDIRLIDGKRVVACGLSQRLTSNSSEYYPSGRWAKSGSSWYYPNGKWAKSGSTWYYPNGKWAKSGSTWYYPNGKWAKSGSSWYYPNGKFASAESLLSWACSTLGSGECQSMLDRVRRSDDFWRELIIVKLAWNAYQNVERSY
jgi:hypothetical protein